jgi:hypothetical protein
MPEPRHHAPRRAHRIGDRLTVTAVHLIVGAAMPTPTDAGQPGRHAAGVLA